MALEKERREGADQQNRKLVQNYVALYYERGERGALVKQYIVTVSENCSSERAGVKHRGNWFG